MSATTPRPRAVAEHPRAGDRTEGSARTADAADAYRAAARRWTTGVGVLTTRSGEDVYAKTVSSLCTLSLDPLLISVAVAARSPLAAAARASGRYAVSVLGAGQEAVARRFAAPGAGHALGLFTQVPMRDDTGVPVLEENVAWFDCRLHTVLPGGDHTVLVGRVVGSGTTPGDPLLYHEGRYHRLHHHLPTSPTGARE
ncbi:flavin reductase family protein [Streptomyces yaizuensis]|uniref:Flavin reductase family protein n=1 Tax=Streptomyces yaizuensis TaxID=2989713 RepID=A0ABQ5NSC3_9ACTN|nr:flavin reductase family protein [Streptomyces sp. YSPA8]GLF93038.1 flavin reductase family protein [Streptomyces sp. YSPA8]